MLSFIDLLPAWKGRLLSIKHNFESKLIKQQEVMIKYI